MHLANGFLLRRIHLPQELEPALFEMRVFSDFEPAIMPFHGPSCGFSASQRCMAKDITELEVPLPVVWRAAGSVSEDA